MWGQTSTGPTQSGIKRGVGVHVMHEMQFFFFTIHNKTHNTKITQKEYVNLNSNGAFNQRENHLLQCKSKWTSTQNECWHVEQMFQVSMQWLCNCKCSVCGPGHSLELKVTDSGKTLSVYLYDQTGCLDCGLLNSIITPSAYWRCREWLHILFTTTKMLVEEYFVSSMLKSFSFFLFFILLRFNFCFEVSLDLFFHPVCPTVLGPRLLN